MNMNDTNFDTDYDYNGAFLYTVVILLLYSLTLFCAYILNSNQDDHYYEKNSAVYRSDKHKKPFHSNQVDILNTLSDQSLRQKYWRIYYGNDEFESRSDKFVSAELKRLSIVSQRMKKLIKRSSQYEELDELNRIITNNSQPLPSTPSLLFKFRRSRSRSIPVLSYSIEHRSYDVLCQTPLCKPHNINLSQNP